MDRKLDAFQSQAGAFLTADPDEVFTRQAISGGGEIDLLAVLDIVCE